jgi:hypothetical protein
MISSSAIDAIGSTSRLGQPRTAQACPIESGNEQLSPSEGGSTVQMDVLTGYEAATLGGQPGGGETDLFGPSQPANRHGGKHPIELFAKSATFAVGPKARAFGVIPSLAVLNRPVTDQ